MPRPARPWTEAEDRVLRTCGERDTYIAGRLKRAVNAVRSRRAYLGIRKPPLPPRPARIRERERAPDVSPEARHRGAVRRRVEDVHAARELARELEEWP